MNYKENEEHIDLDELDSRLFACANVLRGSVDKGRYKDFVLPLVFYAAVNGWYERELENMSHEKEGVSYEELSDKQQEFFRKQTRREFGIQIPEDYTWDDLMQEDNNLSARIDSYLSEFESVNGDRYNNIFNNKFNSIDSFQDENGTQLLRDLLKKIDTIDFSEIPPDIMGEGYMNLVKRFSEAEAGEYFTPPNIVDLMVRLLEPFESGSSFHDPTAGSAGMLVEVAQHLREQYKDEYQREELQEFIDKEFEFTGQEKNPTIAGIAKMNLALHGLKGDIRRGDSLTNPQFAMGDKLDKFDYILANFPFSQSSWKDGTEERQDNYNDMNWAKNGKLPHGNYGDFAFIMHMYSQLEDDGQLATVIPHGILFRNGDKKYRKYMIDENMVEAVIGIPENMFETTNIPSGILVLNKDKKDDEVLFINAAQNRFTKQSESTRERLTENGIAEIKEIFDNREDKKRTSKLVSRSEIEENDYNMNIALYVDTTEPQEDIDVRGTLENVRDIEQEYQQLNQQFTQYMQRLNYEEQENGDKND